MNKLDDKVCENRYNYSFDGQCSVMIEHYIDNQIVSSETQQACTYDFEVVSEGSCSQPYIQQMVCVICHSTNEPQITPPMGHEYNYNNDLGIFVCTRCGMQSSVGVDGDIILEDMTKENSDNIVVGYFNRNSENEFTIVFTLVPKAGLDVETVAFDFNGYTVDNYSITFNMSECKEEALKQVDSLADYDIRMSLIPTEWDQHMDYAITFGNLVTPTEATSN